MARSQLSLMLAALLALTAGCVTRAKYDAMQRERDIFAAQGETLTRESEALADVAAGLEADLALRDEAIAQLERTREELREELDAFIVAGLIKISLMRDGLHVVLAEEILFPAGGAELNEQGRQLIANLVDELQEFPYQIGVLGYTDSVPVGASLKQRYPSNWELAAARAASVVRLMEGVGIASEQLVVVSFGPNRPFASNDTAAGRAQNRRIEIRLRPVAPPSSG